MPKKMHSLHDERERYEPDGDRPAEHLLGSQGDRLLPPASRAVEIDEDDDALPLEVR
jgi:hypothetical protein